MNDFPTEFGYDTSILPAHRKFPKKSARGWVKNCTPHQKTKFYNFRVPEKYTIPFHGCVAYYRLDIRFLSPGAAVNILSARGRQKFFDHFFQTAHPMEGMAFSHLLLILSAHIQSIYYWHRGRTNSVCRVSVKILVGHVT